MPFSRSGAKAHRSTPSKPLSVNQYEDDEDDDDDAPLLPTAVAGDNSGSPAELEFAKLTAELEAAVTRVQTVPFWIGVAFTVVVVGLAVYSAAMAPNQLYQPAVWYLGAWTVVQPIFWTTMLMLRLIDRSAGRSSRPNNQLFVFLAFAGTTIRFYVKATKLCCDTKNNVVCLIPYLHHKASSARKAPAPSLLHSNKHTDYATRANRISGLIGPSQPPPCWRVIPLKFTSLLLWSQSL